MGLDSLDRRAGGNAAHPRDRNRPADVGYARHLWRIARRWRRDASKGTVDDARLKARLTAAQRGVHRIRQFDYFEGPRPVRQPADETALLERRDQPVNAGLAAQIERILHFVERGRD